MIRLTLTLSAALLAGALWLHFDALKRSEAVGRRAGYSEGWHDGASHICKEQIAQGREYGIKDETCLIKSGGRWIKPPGVVRRGQP